MYRCKRNKPFCIRKTSLYSFSNTDLTKPEQIDYVFNEAKKQFNNIDIFIANAGFAYYEKYAHRSWTEMETIFRLNTLSPLYTIQKMNEINKGRPHRTVITSSAMAHLALPGYALYSATKGALRSFSDAYFSELQNDNISIVFPIATKTDFFKASGADDKIWPSQTSDEVANKIIQGISKKRKRIYPSTLFRVFLIMSQFFPVLKSIYLKRQLIRLNNSTQIKDPEKE